MDNSKTIDVLNTLIEINNDRIEGYESASEETGEADLKILFAELTKTSQKCNHELIDEVHSLGGKPISGTTMIGKFFRVWMDVKAAFTSNDRKTILDSCEYGEDVAVEAYTKALKDHQKDITSKQEAMLKAQSHLIRNDHDKVKHLRDNLAAVTK